VDTRKLIAPTLLFVVVSLFGLPPSTAADYAGCSGGATSDGNFFAGFGQCSEPGSTTNPASSGQESTDTQYTAYRWELACNVASGPVHTCTPCPDDKEIAYRLMGLKDGQWYPLGIRCATQPPDAGPTVTPAMVARAFKRIPLPSLRAITQPADKTLINFDTIFYVEAEPLHRTLTLLGQRVELEITPSTFRWVHGDGTTAETHTAGAPYPAKDVVHRYQQAHVTVRQHVEIVWTARWRLNGGALQDVPGTVTTVGPETPLRVAEATPALSGYGH
jgi:hypothetical protein